MKIQEIISEATLIDVRDELELLVDGKIETAINIPMANLEAKIEEIKQLPKPIIFFCKSGGRAGKAITHLNQLGIKELYNGKGYKDMLPLITK